MVNLAPEEPGLYFRLADNSLSKIGPAYVGSVPPNDGAQGSTDYCVGEQWLDVSDPSKAILKLWDGVRWREITPADTGATAAGDQYEVQFNGGNDDLDASPNLTFNGSKLTASNVEITNGNIAIKTDSGVAPSLDFYCEVNNAHYTRLQSAPHAEYTGNVTYTLPPVAPLTLNNFLTSDSAGKLSWAEVDTSLENLDASGIGNDTEVIFIDGASLGSDTGFTFDKATSSLTIAGDATAVNLTLSGDADITGDLDVAGDADIKGNTNIGGNAIIVGNTTTPKITATNFDFSTQAAATPANSAKFIFSNGGGNSKIVTFGNLKSEILKGEIVYYDSSTSGAPEPNDADSSFKVGTIWVDTNPAQVGDMYIFTGGAWEFIHNDYALPAAEAAALGGVKVPTTIKDSGVDVDTNLRMTAANELYAVIPSAIVYIASGDLETMTVPGSPAQGHLYIHTGADGADLWGSGSNGTVDTNDRVIYNAAGGWDIIPGGSGGAFTEETNGIIADNSALNVGIGVATGIAPNAKLEVTKATKADLLIRESAASAGLSLEQATNLDATVVNKAEGDLIISSRPDAGSNKQIRFKTANSHRMQLTKDGNLNLGAVSATKVQLVASGKIKYHHAGTSAMVDLTDISTLPSIADA